MLFVNVTYTVRKPGGTHLSGFLRLWTQAPYFHGCKRAGSVGKGQALPAPRGGANYVASVAELAPFSCVENLFHMQGGFRPRGDIPAHKAHVGLIVEVLSWPGSARHGPTLVCSPVYSQPWRTAFRPGCTRVTKTTVKRRRFVFSGFKGWKRVKLAGWMSSTQTWCHCTKLEPKIPQMSNSLVTSQVLNSNLKIFGHDLT